MDDKQHHLPDPSAPWSRQDDKVAIPRLQNINYHLPTTTRPQRLRTDVVSKAVSAKFATGTIGPELTPSLVHPVSQAKALRKNQTLTDLLLQVSGQLDEESKKRVDDALASFEDDTPPTLALLRPPTSQSKRQRQTSPSHQEEDDDDASVTSADGGEAHVSASVGSNEDLDFVQEDLLQGEEADDAGYMGRNSQVQWLRALEGKVEQPEGEPHNMPYGPPGTSADAFNQRAEALHERQLKLARSQSHQEPSTGYYFYLDATNIDVDIGDPHVIPSAGTAETLFDYYKEAVHSPFKLIDHQFESQMKQYFGRVYIGDTVNVDSKWKAIMNLVFAIGARYSHLIGADWQADDRDHLVYMWRAVHLLQLPSMKTLVSHPDQLLIQATGLLSFYYLIIGHVSRAWYIIGIAIRHAQAAGLHLRHEDPSMPSLRKKTLAQIWWALNSIECAITTITGRPRAIYSQDCTVPPPGTVGTEMQRVSRENTTPNVSAALSGVSRASASSTGETSASRNVDTFDVAHVALDIIMDKILSGLYSARKSVKSWSSAQKKIIALSDELEIWASKSLPQGLSAAAVRTTHHNIDREQFLLHLYYYNAKICVTRPCLCRLDVRIKGQSEESARFNQETAKACLGAAMDMAAILPDVPNPAWYYRNGPWWLAVHMRWLDAMRSVDAVSQSAYSIVTKVLNKQSQQNAAHNAMPRPTITNAPEQRSYGTLESIPGHQQSNRIYGEPSTPQNMDSTRFGSDVFNSGPYFSQPDAGNFYPGDVSGSGYSNDPNAGAFEFGQPQMGLFYGNPYSATLDQWNWDNTAFDDSGRDFDGEPPQQ
ncbi:fungal specific transcription factor domain-containing protein [Stemphylium lycopersici]|nr:fungal specific transcription factor domain-containing protein [Stemphylium lycopersici]